MKTEDEILDELDSVHRKASQFTQLGYILSDEWVRRIRNILQNEDKRRDLDGEFYLFRIFRDGEQGLPVTYILPHDLNERLETIEKVAKIQNKLRAYRKTRRELRSRQHNQVLASIFEIIVLSDLIRSDVQIELSPFTGQGQQDCDACVYIDNRWIYVECKSIGYSKRECGRTPRKLSMRDCINQVHTAIDSKLGIGMQLEVASQHNPTVLCITTGFDAGHVEAYEAIEQHYSGRSSNCSAIMYGESAFIMKGMRPFYRQTTSYPLTTKETQFFEEVFRFQEYKIHRSEYFKPEAA